MIEVEPSKLVQMLWKVIGLMFVCGAAITGGSLVIAFFVGAITGMMPDPASPIGRLGIAGLATVIAAALISVIAAIVASISTGG